MGSGKFFIALCFSATLVVAGTPRGESIAVGDADENISTVQGDRRDSLRVTSADTQTAHAPNKAASIYIASIPPVAEVFMDGRWIGQTNVAALEVLSGTHSMRFVKGGKEVTVEMVFNEGRNLSRAIQLENKVVNGNDQSHR